jgi:hypothetical protein
MRVLSFFMVSFLLFCFGCKNTSENTAGDGIHFGETIDSSGMIAYTDLLAQMAVADSVNAKVVGTVSGVCQTKGCWMNIVSDQDTTKTEMFVQFKDYGFFMPKDLAGQRVVMLGKAYREVTSVDDLKHFAEDEGKSAEEIAAITEPRTELKFMASGVMILK